MNPGETIERLSIFALRTRELADSRLAKSGMNVDFTIKWNVGQPLTSSSNRWDKEDLRSFLTIFRQFVEQQESSIKINWVFNVCQQFLKEDELKLSITKAQTAWKNAFRNSGVRFVINETHLSTELLLDLYLNGEYFHSNLDKRHQLYSLLGADVIGMVDVAFRDNLASLTRIIMFTGNVVRYALDSNLFAIPANQ